MLGLKLSLSTARLGAFCTALALLVFTVGCPGPLPPGPCDDVDCDDGDLCTVDDCEVVDEAAQCLNIPIDCPDGVCNPADGECVTCASDADCPDGVCDQLNDRCVECLLDEGCDDGEFCTDDVCNANVCENTPNTEACDDNNECTDGDVCADGLCSGDPTDGDCDDGDICTAGDTCNSGVCVPGDEIPDCCETDADCVGSVGDICVDNECVPDASTCVQPDDCDDEDLCTVDACVDGTCVFTDVVCPGDEFCDGVSGNCVECLSNADCDDGYGCTVDACSGFACNNIPTDAICDDNQFCTGAEFCDPDDADADADGCVSVGDPCKDGVVDVGKICNEVTDACDDCTSDAECDDFVPCTDDTCVVDTCANVNNDDNCLDPLNCDGDDICDPTDPDAGADGCYAPGNPCDPKLCDEVTFDPLDPAGTCVDCTANAECDDGLTCTLDTCNGVTGDCSHVDTDALCPDALFCDGVDTCEPGNPAADADGCVPNPHECANACNEGTNACFDCESNAECSDGIDCTDDTCDGGTGVCTRTNNCPGLEVCNLQSGECE